LLFELTVSLDVPARQAYIWDAADGYAEQALHHPDVPLTILSRSARKVRLSYAPPQRHRAPAPLRPCPTGERKDQDNEGIVGKLGSMLPVIRPSANLQEVLKRGCYLTGQEDVAFPFLGWLDHASLRDVYSQKITPRVELDVTQGFTFAVMAPANTAVPAGNWTLSIGEQQTQIEVEVGTLIVIVDLDQKPPEVISVMSQRAR
jgi:hypothetical protein